jgi:hypothetical protein
MTSAEAEATFRTFFGLGLALRVFDHRYSYLPSPTKLSAHVHRLLDDEIGYDTSLDMDASIAEVVSHLYINDLDGRVSDGAEKAKWIVYSFRQMASCFQHPERSARVLLASRWLFDSYIGRNQLLSFVQTMIALEILLGDKQRSDLMGLSELLRNRCAYLIGKDQRQREEILDDFGRIYDVRSQIVHRGKSRLSREEQGLFYKLRWMCFRVVQEEIRLLEAAAI